MERAIMLVGNVSALLGVVLCGVAGIGRLLGGFYTLGYASNTLFQAGTGLLVLACFCCLQRILMRLP